ncbi:CDP-alcohol phosphatidyltransferase family protein [Chloroflexota bacterium]
MTKLAKTRKTTSDHITQPVVKLLARTPLTPNTITWLGFWITAGAAVLVVTNHLFAAGFVVLVAGLFDMLDGALARITNRVTRFGAVLDSTLDRLSEAVLLLSILVIYSREAQVTGSLLAGIALLASFMVSYLRARTEALGIECKVGLFTRPERVIVLTLGLLLSRYDYALIIALAIIAFFSFLTAGQRLLHARRHTRT